MDLRDGDRTALCLYDYTGDGELDMILGNLRGGLSFWNSTNTTGVDVVTRTPSFFNLYPNPASTSVDLVLNEPPAKGSRWVIRNNMGQLVQQQQALQQLNVELAMVRRDQESDQAIVDLIQSMVSSGPVYGASGKTNSASVGSMLNALA